MRYHVSPYNEFAPQDYSTEVFNGALNYTRPTAHYKKGGVAKIIGAIVAVVVTVFTAGAAAPAMAAVFGQGLIASVAAGAIGGMVGGAAGALVGGGNVGQGALFGMIGGGITGGMGGFAGGDGFLGSISQAGTDTANAVGGALGGSSTSSVSSIGGAIGGEVANTASTFSTPVPMSGAEGTTLVNQASQGGSLVTQAAPSVQAGLDTAGAQAVANTATGAQPGAGWQYFNDGTAIAPNGAYYSQGAQVTGAAGADGTVGALSLGDKATNVGYAAKNAMATSGLNTGNDSLLGAGLKVGAQYLGSQAEAPGAKAQESYLNDVRMMEQQSQQFNMNMANKKAGIGDKLQASADNIDPQYYAQQGQTNQKNRNANQWADTEQRMRASGASQDAIDAERHRSGVMGSQAEGTAYDSGMQSGRSQQNSTYGTAGSMYGGVSQPTAGLATAYSQNNANNAQAQQAAGNAIEQAFGVVNNSTKKPAAATV